ncbi:peptide deformylase [Entomoplasma freundtii]|uniref:Peptide deformylase n=1 Tax=Entomoplasma freundtii TaxID=74700 RepID=A0A2K8NU33_9MOLU|nr:peptide deformylase [Entomoplasma freundtii]ATZ16271.1 peptide deformylase [Entomoplasma freundtii]TDY56828.1 peptide deformylase [Entomoplasma freundtii]
MSWETDKKLMQEEVPTNRWLVKDTNTTIIRAQSVDVSDPQNLTLEEKNTISRLIDFVRYSQDADLNNEANDDYLRPAVGLAAPQIGINKNMFFVRFEHLQDDQEVAEEFAMINAKIVSRSTQIAALEGGEGCLSVDEDQTGLVPRHYKIVVEGYDFLTQNKICLTLRGYLAIVFQHELDHNCGRLYYDHIDRNSPMVAKEDWFLI